MKIACILLFAAYFGRRLAIHIDNRKLLLVIIDEIMVVVLIVLANLP